MRATLVTLGMLALTGCKLVDQTTFAPSPEAAPTGAASQAKFATLDPRSPLVTIGYSTPNPDYADVLRYAVGAAERRAPGVQYDVIGLLPAGGDAALLQSRTESVMRDVIAQGVPASRIHLSLRGVPAGTPQEVRVYVR
jgi:hypothetical protein